MRYWETLGEIHMLSLAAAISPEVDGVAATYDSFFGDQRSMC